MIHVWERIQRIQRDPQLLLLCANKCAAIYTADKGIAYQPFDASSPDFPQNCVGLQAVITTLPILALLRGETYKTMERIIPALLLELSSTSLSKDNPPALLQEVSSLEKAIPVILANGFWNLTKDFSRKFHRHNNFPLCVWAETIELIPQAQGLLALDIRQIQVAAQFLVEQLGIAA